MKIKEDLVFDKSTDEVIGFIDCGGGNLDHKFVALREQCVKQRFDHSKVATHMLTLMFRGIFLSVIFHWHTFLLKVSIYPLASHKLILTIQVFHRNL